MEIPITHKSGLYDYDHVTDRETHNWLRQKDCLYRNMTNGESPKHIVTDRKWNYLLDSSLVKLHLTHRPLSDVQKFL